MVFPVSGDVLLGVALPLETLELPDGVAPEVVALEVAVLTLPASSYIRSLRLYFPMERFEIGIRVYPRRFLCCIDDEWSNNDNDSTDNQYGEPYSVATCRNLAGRDKAKDKGKQ